MFEDRLARRGKGQKIEILNFPWNDKVVLTLGTDHAVELANKIYVICKTPAPPERWKGMVWVHIGTAAGTYHLLCDDQDAAVAMMNFIGDAIESGDCIRMMLRTEADFTQGATYRVIPASKVERLGTSPVKEVKRCRRL